MAKEKPEKSAIRRQILNYQKKLIQEFMLEKSNIAEKYLGAVFISKDKEMLFVHMLDFEGDLYGKEIEIEIGKRIRNGRKFVSEDDAKEQIGKDVEAIRKIARNKTI